jgi:hypothetical protein
MQTRVASPLQKNSPEKLIYSEQNLPVILASSLGRLETAVTNFGYQTKARVCIAFTLH